MGFFSKRIAFDQFIADLIVGQHELLNSSAKDMVNGSDEGSILTPEEKLNLEELAYLYIILDLMIGLTLHFSEKVSNETIGNRVSFLYIRYLHEKLHLNQGESEKRMEDVLSMVSMVEEIESNNQENPSKAFNELSDEDKIRFAGVQAFQETFLEKIGSKNPDKAFPALKLGKAITKGDLVGAYY